MNKSKFLKRSLAAILAILMVVAMVPMGALAADETFDVSVNSRQADTADGDTYAVTIYNTRLASIDWAPKPDWTAEIKTKRDITLSLPVSSLDLMSEATKVAGTDNVYSLDMTFKNTKEDKTIPAKLNITVETSVPNDDVTLQGVRVNQTFGTGGSAKTFSAINGTKPADGKIRITIPLGMTPADVGFGTDYDTTDADKAVAAQVFVPSSPYATVTYTAPDAANVGDPEANGAQGKVTVTAPTGRKATYDVIFEQETAFTSMKVNFGDTHTSEAEFSGRTFEKGETYNVYTAYVKLTGTGAVDPTDAHIVFEHGDNIVRVEDATPDGGNTSTQPTWAGTNTDTIDEPIQSGAKGENTIVFGNGSGTDAGAKVAWLTAKTRANQKDYTGNDTNNRYFANIKLVLRDKADEPTKATPPVLKELQFNGYEAIRNEDGSALVGPITVNVDASYYEQVGAGKLPARISLTTDTAAKVWVLNQDGSRVKLETEGNRIVKPDSFSGANATTATDAINKNISFIGSFNAKDRRFTIRVEDPDDSTSFTDYQIKLSSSGTGAEIKRVRLIDNKNVTIAEAVKGDKNEFVFYVDKGENGYPNSPILGSQSVLEKPGEFEYRPSTTANFETETAEFPANNLSLQLKYNFVADDGGIDFFSTSKWNTVFDPASTDTRRTPREYVFRLRWAGDATDGKLVLEANDRTLAAPDWKIVAVGENDADNKKINFKKATEVDADLTSATSVGYVEFDWLAGSTDISGGAPNPPTWGSTEWWDTVDNTTAPTDSPLHPGTMSKLFPEAVMVKNNTTDTAGDTVYKTKVNAYTDNAYDTGYETINSDFQNAYLVIESDKGVVLTPGGDMKSTLGSTAVTTVIGASEWGQENTAYTATMDYDEHENYVSLMSKYWVPSYLLDISPDGATGSPTSASADNYDSVLVMTAKNQHSRYNADVKTWIIRFEDKASDSAADALSEAAELTFKGATTAVDEDLIFDGRTRTDDGFVEKTTTVGGSTVNAGPYDNDAAYIGAIGARGNDHNNFKIEVSKLEDNGSGEKNASVVKIYVPEDYFVDGQEVYFYGMTASAKTEIYRQSDGTADSTTAGKPAANWYETNLVEKYNLVMDDQTQQTGVEAFVVETDTWNGNKLSREAVDPDNILYVYSEKDAKVVNDSTKNPGKLLTAPTSKYYITFVKDNFDTTDTMSGVTAADSSTGITGTPNAYEKWLNLSVPFGKNWTNYRDDSSRDFKLNFIKGGEAILVDAAQDTHNGPFGSASMGTTYLDKARQELREAQIDKDTVFFVKENELWIYDQYTGKETKVTGRGLNTKFTYSGWGVITSGNAELHVFNEDQRSINTYRLTLNVNEASSAKEIVSIRVDETSAKPSPDGKTWTVDLGPAGSENLAKVMLNITVSATAQVVSVGGKEYVANGTYDLTKPVTIIVKDENGDTKSFTLSATGDDPNPPVEEKESDKYTDIPSGAMGDWVKDAINYGIMSSNVSGKYEFQPKATTPRRYFALMVARADIMANNGAITTKEAADEKLLADYGDKEPDFKDTAKEDPKIKAAIVYCQEKKIMNGDEKGNFNPGDIVDRMQVASMLANWLKLTPGDKTENTHGFKDWDKIASWAKGNINAVATDKIMEGNDDDTFGTGELTREQTAVVMVKVYERLKGITD